MNIVCAFRSTAPIYSIKSEKVKHDESHCTEEKDSFCRVCGENLQKTIDVKHYISGFSNVKYKNFQIEESHTGAWYIIIRRLMCFTNLESLSTLLVDLKNLECEMKELNVQGQTGIFKINYDKWTGKISDMKFLFQR